MLPTISPVPVSSHFKQKLDFCSAPFKFSVNKVSRMEAEDFTCKIQFFAGLRLEKQSQKAGE